MKEWQGKPFRLLGLGDFWEDPDVNVFAASYKDSGLPTIAITHNPDLFPHIPSHVSFVLAGHTHGGQVNFPIIGAPVVPSQFGQRYKSDSRHFRTSS